MVMTNLQQRIISSVLMTAIGLGCIIAGGQFFFTMLAILCVACLYEVWQMRLRPAPLKWGVMAYILTGFSAAYYFHSYFGWIPFLLLSSTVILTDIGAYAAGKSFGGPKLAPRISPSKTWAGALGGLLISVLFILGLFFAFPAFVHAGMNLPSVIIMTVIISIAAQSGDLFESWLKRRAGIKDSSNYIPGHGGFFDRLDGWIAAFLVNGFIHAVLVYL